MEHTSSLNKSGELLSDVAIHMTTSSGHVGHLKFFCAKIFNSADLATRHMGFDSTRE